MSRSGYFKDLGNFGQQILNQVASDIRSNAENLVFSFGQEGSQQQNPRNNPDQGSDQPSNKTSRSEASTPSGGSSRTPPPSEGPPRARRSSSASSSQATTPDEVAGDWLNSVSFLIKST